MIIKRQTRSDIIANTEQEILSTQYKIVRFNSNNYWLYEAIKDLEFKSKKVFDNFIKSKKPKERWEAMRFYGYTETEISEAKRKDKLRAKKSLETRRKNNTPFSCFTVEFWMKRGHSEEDARKKVREYQSNNSKKVKNRAEIWSIEYWIKKGHSEEEARKKVSEHQRKNSKRCIEHWIKKGHSEEEARKKVSEYQSAQAEKVKEKYTIEERREFNHLCPEYWRNSGYSEEQIQQILKENGVTFSLEKCIERHGEKLGYDIWLERQIKWQNSINERYDTLEKIQNLNSSKRRKMPYDAPGIFYAIFLSDNRVKIGITVFDIDRRYIVGTETKYDCESFKFDNISDAYAFERFQLAKYKDKIKKNDYGMFGWTEVINNIDKQQLKEQLYEDYKTIRNIK